MKILYIVPYVPNLIRVRPYNLIRHLSILGHELTVATIISDPAELKDVAKLKSMCTRIITVEMPAYRSMINSLVALLQRIPMQSRYSWHPELFSQIIGMQEQPKGNAKFDVVQIEHLRGIEYGLHLLSWQGKQNGHYTPPVIWDSVDCISALMRQTGQWGSSLKSRSIASMEYKPTTRYESKGIQLFDRVLVTSPNDQQDLTNIQDGIDRHGNIEVLPNGVDLQYFMPGSIKRRPDTIVISGKMSYHANEAMVKYLVKEIMPLVWVRKGNIKLQIVGKDPPQSIQSLAENPLITVTGTVSDIRPYLQQATLAVVPIIYGTGIQNKILEAMACCTPVVVSAKAASSLLAIPNQDCLVVETARQFADGILDLFDDPQKRKRLGIAGRAYVEKNHDWLQIASKLVHMYEKAITCKQEAFVRT